VVPDRVGDPFGGFRRCVATQPVQAVEAFLGPVDLAHPGQSGVGDDSGVDESRADGGDGDPLSGELSTQGTAERQYGGLGGRVGAVDAGGQVGGGRGGVDDAAAAARLHHHRGEGTTPVDHPPKVDVDDPSEVFGGGFQERSGHTDTGVVDHQVGCSVCGVDPGGELVHGGGVGDVHPLGASPGCEPGTQF